MGIRICQVKNCTNKLKLNQKKYCSKTCMGLGARKVRSEVYCDNCDGELNRRRKREYYSRLGKRGEHNKFCGKKCFREYQREIRVCEYCEKDFEVPKNKPQRFCNPDCSQNNQRNKYIKQPCSVCGTEIKVNPYDAEKNGRCKSCKSTSPKRIGSYILTQEEYRRALGRFRSRLESKRLTDKYIKDLMSLGKYSPRKENIPKSLIEAKRIHLKIKREIKMIKQ